MSVAKTSPADPSFARRSRAVPSLAGLGLAAASLYFRRVAGIRPEEGRSRRGSRRGADEAGGLPDLALGTGGREGHGRRIRLDDLRPLRALPHQGRSRSSRRSTSTRQGPLHVPRVPARQPRRRRLDAGALHRPRQDIPADRGAVREAGGMGVRRGNPVPRLFEIAKQAGFTQEVVRQVPDGPEAARRDHRRPHARLRSVRRARRRRPSSSTARARRPRQRWTNSTRCSSRCWPRAEA